MKRELPLLSSTWVHFAIFIVHFTLLENSMAANKWGKETYKLSSVTKSQLSISSPSYRGALVPEYSISEESFIFESVKGQVQSFDTQACKTKCQKHKVSARKLTIFFHVFELASDTAIASRWGLKCAPCLDSRCLDRKAIICELPTLYLSRKTSFIAAEVP